MVVITREQTHLSAQSISTPLEGNDYHRFKGLKKLGVSEKDVALAETLLAQIPPAPCPPRGEEWSKSELILGYALIRLRRAKALKILGASEEDVDLENCKNLSALGVGGRRRSFTIVSPIDGTPQAPLVDVRYDSDAQVTVKVSSPISTRKRNRKNRRRSTTDIWHSRSSMVELELVRVRKEHESSQAEIKKLREHVFRLEKQIENSPSTIPLK
mmetsp:Transcript_21207/g.24410  ORF Transcript_21207/g.24410 Transcript_21207/m.24410 type:complete len:214 (-) Transcript_21207:98-739(-)|eukprot:CAMPEP_0194357338 /NCGR_PEP_ID=MMETSP0174-20130528/4832_1 /TAXON_ID=216777 /ORGANISM="Proboscia alata, Strain PI-D3" /LENGTH=213 /DNA_ID=CAMNT_0039127311 /DNA_START=39 /DNA_END=680 /DNA_ORIENTATION=-